MLPSLCIHVQQFCLVFLIHISASTWMRFYFIRSLLPSIFFFVCLPFIYFSLSISFIFITLIHSFHLPSFTDIFFFHLLITVQFIQSYFFLFPFLDIYFIMTYFNSSVLFLFFLSFFHFYPFTTPLQFSLVTLRNLLKRFTFSYFCRNRSLFFIFIPQRSHLISLISFH